QNNRLTTCSATTSEYTFILLLSPGYLDPLPEGRGIVELIEHRVRKVGTAQPEGRAEVLGDAAAVASTRGEVVQRRWTEHRPVEVGPGELGLEARSVPPPVPQDPSHDVLCEEAEHRRHPEVLARSEGSDEDASLDSRGAHAGDQAPSALRVDLRGSEL